MVEDCQILNFFGPQITDLALRSLQPRRYIVVCTSIFARFSPDVFGLSKELTVLSCSVAWQSQTECVDYLCRAIRFSGSLDIRDRIMLMHASPMFALACGVLFVPPYFWPERLLGITWFNSVMKLLMGFEPLNIPEELTALADNMMECFVHLAAAQLAVFLFQNVNLILQGRSAPRVSIHEKQAKRDLMLLIAITMFVCQILDCNDRV